MREPEIQNAIQLHQMKVIFPCHHSVHSPAVWIVPVHCLLRTALNLSCPKVAMMKSYWGIQRGRRPGFVKCFCEKLLFKFLNRPPVSYTTYIIVLAETTKGYSLLHCLFLIMVLFGFLTHFAQHFQALLITPAMQSVGFCSCHLQHYGLIRSPGTRVWQRKMWANCCEKTCSKSKKVSFVC